MNTTSCTKTKSDDTPTSRRLRAWRCPGLFAWLFVAGCLLIPGAQESLAQLTLLLPNSVLEGSGVVTNAGSFRLSLSVSSNVVVALSSSNPALVIVPETVTVLAGQTNVTFNLTVEDNATVATAQRVTILANTPGFGSVSNSLEILENDAHHIRFSSVGWLQTTGSAFGILLTAHAADGNRLTNFHGSAALTADGLEGALPMDITDSGSFAGGQRYLSVTVLAPGRAVRLRSSPPPGESDAFNVGLPPFMAVSQRVMDIAWHEPSQTLFATVPANGGVYSNQLVAIDPATGDVTNSYSMGIDPGQIELASSGNWLYVAISNAAALRRFDITTRQAGLQYALGTSAEPVRFAYDFCVAPGMADSVVVETRDRDFIGNTYRTGIKRYDGGMPVSLPNFDASGGWLLEPMSSGAQVLLSPPLAKGNATTGVILATATDSARNLMTYRDGVIYDDAGNFFSAVNLGLLGSYPGVLEQLYHTALTEVSPAARRVFYLAGYFNYGASFYKLRVYDRDLLHPLFQLPVPSSPGTPSRFIRWGTNGLAYATGNGELWFIRPDLIQPDHPPADLHLSLTSSTPVAVVGNDYHFTLTVSNAGPGVASLVRVTNALPANALAVQTLASNGSVTLTDAAFTWKLSALGTGSNATLEVTLRFGNAGWQTNFTCALGFEVDSMPANNTATLPLYVELPPEGFGVFPVNAATENLLYDPVRDRLVLSVGNNPAGPDNGIAVFDPYRGLSDSFTPLDQRPARMARSLDGQFLYVSLPDVALVRRLSMSSLSQNLEFTLGGEDINGTWYPFYAADMAVVPGRPDALVAWRVRRAGPMAGEYGWGIGVFDDGVMRSNVTAAGGNWRVEFDTDAGTLFGYNNGDLRRCAVDANGVTFAETFPSFYSAGDDVEYAAGQLFSTAGRVLETQPFKVAWVVAGAESAGLVEPDAAANRFYYLIQTNGWQIKVHELASRRWLGSIAVPNVAGTPTSLIRWGTNGLAFRTTSNQLFVIRSPLIQPQASADVVLQISGPTVPVEAGGEANFILIVTNRGPASAAAMQITNQFSPVTTIVSADGSSGSWSTNGGMIIWSLSALEAGAQATLTYTMRAGSAGVVTVTASAVTATPDPVPGNNHAVFALQVGDISKLESVAQLKLAANDLVWSPSLGRLLVTASNSAPHWAGALLSIDPLARTVRFESTLGGNAGRLAHARDDSLLYAGVDYGLNALTLPALAITNRFLINPAEPRAQAHALEVVPGDNLTVLAGSRSVNNNSTWLGIYEDGAQRTNVQSFNSTGFSLEFGDDPALFYYQDHTSGGFRRYAVQTNGISLLDTHATLLPSSTPITLAWADGYLFTSVGILIDPFTRTRLGNVKAITNNSALCYDAAAGRAYYISSAGAFAYLHAIDKATLVAVGSRLVPGVSGTPGSLTRWGTNGLAFRTGGGQVFILHTQLIPNGPPADLALDITALEPLATVGSNFVYSISVTNSGPNAAPDSQVLFRVSTNAIVTTATTSAGSIVIHGSELVVNLGLLAVDAAASVNVTVVPAQPGSLYAVAGATSGTPDPDQANNVQALTNSAALVLAPGATTILSQTANDLAYNPLEGRLYVSGAAGGVSVINPAYALVETNWPMPSVPGRLALSDDARFLYAALDAGRRVGRINTTNGALELDFSLGTNVSTPFVLLDMAVVPGFAASLAVSKQGGGLRSVQVLDDGVLRPGVQLSTVVNHLEFGRDPNVLYGTGLRKFLIGSTNLTEQGAALSSVANENLEFAGDHFYTTGGKRAEATSRVILGSYAGLGAGTLVEPDLANGRIYFLTRVANIWQVRSYEPATLAFLGSAMVTNVLGNPTNLVRWGADGLAFCTTSNQLFLLRSPLAPAGPTADLNLTQSVSSGPHFVGSNLTFTLTLTNAGPNPATNVVLLNRFPTNAVVVSVTSSQGSITQAAGLVSCLLGTLTNGGRAEVQLTLQPLRAGNFSLLGVATSDSHDPAIEDNSVTLTLPVRLNLGSDAVGVVDLRTADLAYDPVSGLLYATPTNHPGDFSGSIVKIDPATGLIGTPIPVGPDLSQLTISDDGSNLTVLADRGREFRRIQLPGGTMELRVPFSIATGQSESMADEIKRIPQQSEALAVVLKFPGALGGGSPSLVVYDNATPRPALAIWQNTFEFFSTNLGLGLYWNSVPQKTTRIELNSTGFVERASANDLLDGIPIAGDGGMIYSTGGTVFDPMTLTKIGSFYISGLVAPDPMVGRVYFLSSSGTTRQLRCFDPRTRIELGSLTITNVLGEATRLLRCGEDRFAFRTSSGQVFILRTSLVPDGPPADLTLVQNAHPNPVFVGSNLLYTLVVTNNGPHAATNILITDALPPSVAFVSASASSGVVSNSANTVTWRLSLLANGESANLGITVTPSQMIILTNTASVTSSSMDPSFTNNFSVLTTPVAYLAAPDGVQEIKLAARDLVYDPVTARIYASGIGVSGGAGSSIFPVNPENGVIEPPIFVGDNPGRLAVSEDGRYLHVGLNGASAIRRVDMQTRTADLLFSIGELMDVQDMVALPDSPASVAVSRRWLGGSPLFRGVVIYDHGIARSNTLSSHTGPNAIEPGPTGSVLYGFNLEDSEGGFYRMNVDAGGVSLLDMRVGLVPAFTGNILYSGGRIYTTDGLAINPQTLTSIGLFAGVTHASPVTANPDSQHVFYLMPTNSDWALRAFHSDTFAPVATIPVTNVSGGPMCLIRCGADRLAFVTTGGQLFLTRTSLMPAADVMVLGSFTTNQVMVGDVVDLQLVVSNAGPHAASGVLLTNRLPDGLNLISMTASQGTVITNDQEQIAFIGNLVANAAATVNLLVSPGGQSQGRLINSVKAAGTPVPDPLLFNNHLTVELFVLPRDRDGDGLPDDWELTYGLDPDNPLDAQFDSDCDGLTNLEEYLAGRNPRLYEDIHLLSPRLNAQQQFQATLQAPVGKEFTLEASTNLIHWQPIDVLWTTVEHQEVRIPISSALHNSFFRLRTDISAPRPVLSLMSAPLPAANAPLIRVVAPPGYYYSLETSSNLVYWTTVTNYFGLECVTVIANPVTNLVGTLFYRVSVP
ncbi:MAG: DUF11 domain-containing protein [Verrucomicrobia bacterium]|nr:DUF11 domain-containing protein [Verrucomicrobiota bacterium]